MVGLLIVSHSRDVASAVAHLARTMSSADVPIAHAGGVGDDQYTEYGTDATAILSALLSVDSPEGTLILVDIASAQLSTEAAIDAAGSSLSGPVRLISAPLVEGALAAAATIAFGANLDQAAAEAYAAPFSKRAFMSAYHSGEASTEASTEAPRNAGWAAEADLVVGLTHGLHLRPALQFLRTVNPFEAEVEIRNLAGTGGWVNARSINNLTTLGLGRGHRAAIRARGRDAAALIAALRALAHRDWGLQAESASTAPQAVPEAVPEAAPQATTAEHRAQPAERRLQGIGAADGVAIAKAAPLPATEFSFSSRVAEPVYREQERWLSTLETLESQLRLARDQHARNGVGQAAEVVDAQRMMLTDPALLAKVESAIARGARAELALWETVRTLADRYASLDDPYQRDRASDLLDVARHAVALMDPATAAAIEPPDEPHILITDRIRPTLATRLQPGQTIGLVVQDGSLNGHGIILARGLGIPIVAGCAEALTIAAGSVVAIDGRSGSVWVEPSTRTAERVAKDRSNRIAAAAERRAQARRPGTLKSGRPLPVYANVSSPADALIAAQNGADGIGLLRTEALFLSQEVEPTEEEQVEAWRASLQYFTGKPITIRLLDRHGDKGVPPGPNTPAVSTHLRALLQAAFGHQARLLIPMVRSAAEPATIRALLLRAHQELAAQQRDHLWPIAVGAMIETPAAVLAVAEIAAQSDFFSIGTNDLTALLLATSRDDLRLAAGPPIHPAVAQAVRICCAAARRAGIPVGTCGELAGEINAGTALIGLGVDSLSVAPGLVAQTKEWVRTRTRTGCRAAARIVLGNRIGA